MESEYPAEYAQYDVQQNLAELEAQQAQIESLASSQGYENYPQQPAVEPVAKTTEHDTVAIQQAMLSLRQAKQQKLQSAQAENASPAVSAVPAIPVVPSPAEQLPTQSLPSQSLPGEQINTGGAEEGKEAPWVDHWSGDMFTAPDEAASQPQQDDVPESAEQASSKLVAPADAEQLPVETSEPIESANNLQVAEQQITQPMPEQDVAVISAEEQADYASYTDSVEYSADDTSYQQGYEEAAIDAPYVPRQDIIQALALENAVADDLRYAKDIDNWANLVEQTGLVGLQRQLVLHSSFAQSGQQVTLTLVPAQAHLNEPNNYAVIKQRLQQVLQQQIELNIQIGDDNLITPFEIQRAIDYCRLQYAKHSLQADANVQLLQQTFGAQVVEASVVAL